MSDIPKIDRNFHVESNLNLADVKFYDIQDEPFSLYGVFYENGLYRRMPEQIAKSVSPQVWQLHDNTAGGRVKFVTNSRYVAIRAIMPQIGKMPHFPLTGSAGFDLYAGRKEEYVKTFTPPFAITDGFESVIRFDSRAKREITINFPLYSAVSALYIGLEEDAFLKKAPGYAEEKPIVFYGSSITQGGCASRPGNAYTSLVSRALQWDHINLGFSGSAKAEDSMAEYIASLDMSLFVYDYDHNAPTVEHLRNTHQKMFRMIRQAQPELPIVILSAPAYKPNALWKERMEVVRETYNAALADGDRNVCFLDGPTLMKYARNNGTVDNCHPNDLGFHSMAKVLTKTLKSILK